MLVTLALIAAANMPNLLSYPTKSGKSTTCTSPNDATVAANIITIFCRAYIPFAVILILDIIVFKRLKNSKRRVGVTQMGQRKQEHRFSNKEYNFIISTIIIDLTFVLFYTPIAGHVTITVVDIYVSWDRLTSAIFNVYYNTALLTAFLYSVSPFFIFFTLNRYFRNEVLTLLRLNKIFPNYNQTVMDTASTLNANRT